MKQSTESLLEAANQHLAIVQQAATGTDPTELSKHALACIEALMRALDAFDGEGTVGPKWSLAREARAVAGKYPLPDISVLLEDLRAATAGEEVDLSPTNIVLQVEDFFDRVVA